MNNQMTVTKKYNKLYKIQPDYIDIKKKIWQMKTQFIEHLLNLQHYLSKKKNNNTDTKTICSLCKYSENKIIFSMNRIQWSSMLIHYIDKHDYIPSTEFIDFIFSRRLNYELIKPSSRFKKYSAKKLSIYDKNFLKLTKDQINILDSLMHSGANKIYGTHENKFSEHAGFLDFDDVKLEKIVVSPNAQTIDYNDSDIFLPDDIEELYDYEYFYHTHPPTGGIAGRVDEYVLYDFPSAGDIVHFIDRYNNGEAQGSIVVAPEGIYIIRKLNFDNNKIIIKNYNKFFKKAQSIYSDINMDAIEKYTSIDNPKISKSTFYNSIMLDTSYLDTFNKYLNKFDIHIDYFHRIKLNNKWVLDTIYLPIYSVE